MSVRREAAPGQLQVDARLTQHYRLANPFGGSKIAPLCDAQGRFHVFTLGSDGHLYEVYQDPGSDSGWSKADMQFTGSGIQAFAAGVGSDGITMVFVGDSAGNMYSIRDVRWSTGWQQFGSVSFPPIVAVQTCHDHAGELRCTVQSTGDDSVYLYWMDYTQSNNNWGLANCWSRPEWTAVASINDYQVGLDASLVAEDVNKGLSTWLVGSCSKDGETYCQAGKRTPWLNGTDNYFAWNEPVGFKRISLAPNPSNTRDSVAFTLWGADNGLYLVDSATRQLTKLSGTVPLAEIAANLDGQGLLGVIAIGIDGRLYHVRQDATSPTGWTEMAVLNDTMTFSAIRTITDLVGNVVAFALDAQQMLWQVWRDPTTQEWHFAQIEVGTGPLQQVMAYVTRITALDSLGTARPGAELAIWSSGPTPAMVNGAAARLDPVLPMRCLADANGSVTVVIDADALDTPTLTLEDDQMIPGERIVAEPNYGIQAKLRSLTADDLLNAKNRNGQPITLLTGDYATQEVAGAIAQACNQAMDMVGGGKSGPSTGARRHLSARSAARAARRVAAGAPITTGRIDPGSVPDMQWMISFRDGPVFTPLPRSEAQALMAQRRITLRDAGAWYDVDWGDIWDDAVGTVTEVFDVIVSATVDVAKDVVTEIKAMVTLIVDGVESYFEATIDFVEQVFTMVEGFFEKVGVLLGNLWDWLADLFDWTDISLTAQVVSHVLDVGLDFSASAAEHAQSVLINKIEEASDFIDAGMENFITSFSAGRSIDDIGRSRANSPYADLGFYNPLLDAVLDYYGSMQTKRPLAAASGTLSPVLQVLLDKLSSLADQFENGRGKRSLDQAVAYFAAIKAGAANVLDLLVKGLLETAKAVALIALDAAEVVISALFAAIEDVIGLLRSVLTAPLDIPLVNELYYMATGNRSYSLVDLAALIVAIPANAAYHLAFGSAPFTAEAVSAVTTNLTIDWLRQQAWGREPGAAPPAAEPWLQNLRGACDALYGANFMARTGVETVINLSPVPVPPLMWFNLVQRLLSSALSIPWVMKDQPASPFDASAAGLENFIWILQLIFGPVRGGIILASGQIEFGDPTLTLWGAIHLVMEGLLAGLEDDENHPDPEKTAERVLACLAPQFLKVLRLPPVQAATDDLSPIALAIVTFLSEPTICILHLVRTLPPAAAPQLVEQRPALLTA